MTKVIIILISISLIIWATTAIHIIDKVEYNYKYARELRDNFNKWTENHDKNIQPTGNEVGKLFKALYPGRPFLKGEAKFPEEPDFPNNFRVDFIKDFPIYKSVQGTSLKGIYNKPDIDREETKIIYGMYRDSKDAKEQIKSALFWIDFIICFPSQLMNILHGVFSLKTTSSKRISIVNIIYWIYEITSIFLTLYKII